MEQTSNKSNTGALHGHITNWSDLSMVEQNKESHPKLSLLAVIWGKFAVEWLYVYISRVEISLGNTKWLH